MAYTHQELKHKTLAELRDIAKDIEHEAVQGYTQLNKEHLVVALCRALNIDMRRGVYAALTGPSYETHAEIHMVRTLGADAVGMSTVPEAIVARHMDMRVIGISCITNLAAGWSKEPLSHKEVLETAERVKATAAKLLTDFARLYGEKQ